jgi:uncharacterized protein YecT (DUF1311 family)
MRKAVLSLVLLALPVTVFSASAEFLKCINAEDHSAVDGCASNENERQTLRMNAAYKAALKSKGADTKTLKKAQNRWSKQLEKSCPEYSATASAYEEWQQCLAEKTEIRAIELEKMLSLAEEDSPDDVFRLVYKARLSEKDHFNSSGQRLKKAVEVLRQDRANFHVFNVRDTEDEYDETFKDKESRAYMEKTLYIPPKVEKAILNGTPIVKVKIVGDGGDVSLISDR